MNKVFVVLVALLGFALTTADADAARRLGGGSNLGAQRSVTPPSQKAPTQQAQTAPAPATTQPQAGNRWLGPLAGLAIGAALASLFFNNGFAGALAGILMVMLLVAAAIFVVRLLRSRMQPSTHPVQFSGAGGPGMSSDISSHFGSGASAAPVAVHRYPPGFDAAQFARHAKLNFMRLQSANDARDLSTMREFMTPELYKDITAQVSSWDSTPQKTEVPQLDAEVVDVATEGDTYTVSVRFSGMIRERTDAPAEPFSEVWHLTKPVDGSGGWVIAGIQQD